MDKAVKEWLEKKKQQVGQVQSEPVPEKSAPQEHNVKEEKVETKPLKSPVDINKNISKFAKESAEKRHDTEDSIAKERLNMSRFDLPDHKLPKPKTNMFGLNRRRIMIILVTGLVGTLTGYFLFTFIFG
jgi:hypothetical protein